MDSRAIVAMLMLVLLCASFSSAAGPQENYAWRSATIKANGFINGIIFSPLEKDLVYMYTDMGGAYRWDQPAKRWTPLNDWSAYNDSSAQHMGVEAMACDPADVNRVYMVIGTYNSPAGMCRSDDRGKTWQRTIMTGADGKPTIRTNGNGNGRNGGNRLAVDPNFPANLWYGTRRDGLWRSTDRGVTWTRVESFKATGDEEGDASQVGIIALLVDRASGTPGNASQTLYAFVSTTGPEKAFRSTDGGATWSPLPGTPPTQDWYPIRAALTPDGQTLYATFSNSPGPNGATAGEVYKIPLTESDKAVWTTLPLPKLSAGGWSGVCIDPRDPNHVVVSTLDRWGAIDDVYRSTDAGGTWMAMETNTHRDDSSAPYAKSSKVHWVGDVQIDPFDANHAMFTTGYGLYNTRQLGSVTATHKPTWVFFNEGFEQVAVLELASPFAGPVPLFSAIGDRDGYRHENFDISPPEGLLGQSTGMGRGTSDDIDVAQNDPNKLVRIVRSAPNVQFSDDNGMTWHWLQPPATGQAPERDGTTAISADGSRVLYSPIWGGRRGGAAGGGPNPLVYATRGADGKWSDWQRPTGELPQPGAKVLVDLAEGNTFYAFSEGGVSRSNDGGATWQLMTRSVPAGVRWMRAVPGNAGHLLAAAVENGVHRSTDGGATWTHLAAQAVTNAYACGVGAPATAGGYPSFFIAGSANGQTGFFRSDDQGNTWIRVNDDAHQYGYVTVIQGDSRTHGRLYVGTNGRGVIVGDKAQ